MRCGPWEDNGYIRLPLHIEIPRKTMPPKKVYLNQNIFRNLHFQVINQCKRIFEEVVRPQILARKKIHGKDVLEHTIYLEFIYFNGSRRKSDLSNHCVVVDKFFSDCLVQEGIIPDDDYDNIKEVSYRYGHYIKNDEHVAVRIYFYLPREKGA